MTATLPRLCPMCRKYYTSPYGWQKYCTPECARHADRKRCRERERASRAKDPVDRAYERLHAKLAEPEEETKTQKATNRPKADPTVTYCTACNKQQRRDRGVCVCGARLP